MQRDLPPAATVRWPARLQLAARREGNATRLQARHEGPLRLLKTLYPEGDSVAHAVLVHPPGGLVGGDRLDIFLDVQPGAHLLATTPAATRFYRSAGPEAAQVVQAHVAAGARLEWLPQETLAYSACRARNELRVALHGELIASELLALGLSEAERGFEQGELLQHLEIEGLWQDRGLLRAHDRALLDGPCGLDGHRVLGTLLLAHAQPFEPSLAEALLEDARLAIAASGVTAGATLLHGRLVLLRLLAHELEPAAALIHRVRAGWRERAWGLAPHAPRVWAT